MKPDVLIIGAGAAGLLAMKELLAAGYSVCLLEAASTPGGRIGTISENGFEHPIETGAEFIHGNLPLTLNLLKEANVHTIPLKGKMIGIINGEWNRKEPHEDHWDKLMQRLRHLKVDMSVNEFLDIYFAGAEYTELRNAARRFAEGFDLADIKKASILSMQQEWENEDSQSRVAGGYGRLIEHLYKQCVATGGQFFFNSAVREVNYTNKQVLITTSEGKKYEASRLIITASLGVLKSGMISFTPKLELHKEALDVLEFGTVIKLFLEFKSPFWKLLEKDLGFLLTDELIPTWWTQFPSESTLLTGWLGGPPAALRKEQGNDALLNDALHSLSQVFHMPQKVLSKQLMHYKIIDWFHQPYVLGGYSYITVHSKKAIEILSQPVAGRIYFAGEAINNGKSQGTVEAALYSGQTVAKKIMEEIS
jgi:monoamine oxidase